VDVENVLGIHRNVKGLGYTPRKGLGVSNVKTEVDNLVQNKQPFNALIIENGEQSSQAIESSHKSSRRNHSHSRSHSDNHSHSGSHSHHRHHRSHNNVSTERRSHSHRHRHHHHHHHRSHSNDNTERRSPERSSFNRPDGRNYSRNNFF
jgi:cell division septum initiation protein DivIVA